MPPNPHWFVTGGKDEGKGQKWEELQRKGLIHYQWHPESAPTKNNVHQNHNAIQRVAIRWNLTINTMLHVICYHLLKVASSSWEHVTVRTCGVELFMSMTGLSGWWCVSSGRWGSNSSSLSGPGGKFPCCSNRIWTHTDNIGNGYNGLKNLKCFGYNYVQAMTYVYIMSSYHITTILLDKPSKKP